MKLKHTYLSLCVIYFLVLLSVLSALAVKKSPKLIIPFQKTYYLVNYLFCFL
jgi:hypothetical protein